MWSNEITGQVSNSLSSLSSSSSSSPAASSSYPQYEEEDEETKFELLPLPPPPFPPPLDLGEQGPMQSRPGKEIKTENLISQMQDAAATPLCVGQIKNKTFFSPPHQQPSFTCAIASSSHPFPPLQFPYTFLTFPPFPFSTGEKGGEGEKTSCFLPSFLFLLLPLPVLLLLLLLFLLLLLLPTTTATTTATFLSAALACEKEEEDFGVRFSTTHGHGLSFNVKPKNCAMNCFILMLEPLIFIVFARNWRMQNLAQP